LNSRKNRLIVLGIISVIFIIFNSLITIQSNLIVENISPTKKDFSKKPLDIQPSQIPDDTGGYSSINAAYFNTIENASSIVFKRDYLANESSYFNITTPQTWNITSMQFDLDPYSKEQIIEDPYFDQEYNGFGQYWDTELIESGQGVLTQFPLDNYPYARTNIYNLKKRLNPAFESGDHAFWTHEFNDLKLGNLDIQRGRINQEEDEQIRNFNDFQTDPNFYQDLDSPYGGTYDPLLDIVDLYYDESIPSLRVEIEPSISLLGGNPSAAWWYFVNIPYEVDFAQMTLKWSIDEDSSFEAVDQYEVIARINDRYIDGSNPISKTGEIPFNGSNSALMVYDNTQIPGCINHDTISRTYNITELINGLVGNNKFDFGIWAKNPTQQGDNDKIIANFESIEIMFNTTTKYEVAALHYKYKLIDNDKLGYNTFGLSNEASFFLYLRDIDTDKSYLRDIDTDKSELIRVLPFSMAQVSSDDFSDTPWIDMEFSISQKYQDFLKADKLEFKIGVYFEEDFNVHINYDHYLDDAFFTINYNQTVTNPQLIIKIDNSPTWDNVTNNIHTINTSSWVSGENHSFQFSTLNASFQNKLYLNY
jgi:hypothetical protein